jgi:hypothetical protein
LLVHLICAAVSDVGIVVAPSFPLTVHTVFAMAVASSVSDSRVIVPPAAISNEGVNQNTSSPATVLVASFRLLSVRIAPPHATAGAVV